MTKCPAFLNAPTDNLLKPGVLLSEFMRLSVNGHFGQLDKAGKPYILHCLRVMGGVDSDDEELQCIAVAHDVVEDGKVTYQDLIDAGATKRVLKGIWGMTRIPGETEDEYRARICENLDCIKCKLSDLKDNGDITRLKGVTEKDFARMKKYHESYLLFKRKLKEWMTNS